MKIKIAEIRFGNRFRQDLGDISLLAKNIEKNGLLHPVVVTEKNELICGRRRIEAVAMLGKIEIEANVMNTCLVKLGMSEAEVDENIVRKSFTLEEITAIDEYLRKKEEGAARERVRTLAGRPPGNFPTGRSRQRIAARVGVSDRTLEKIRELKKAVTCNPSMHGSIWDKVNTGTISIDKGYRMVKQRQKIEEARKGASKKLEASSNYNLKLGDFREIGKEIDKDSIDLIFTDPPYNEESIPLYGELAKLAQQVLKAGGSLITFIGNYGLFKIGKQIADNSQLEYHWLFVVKHNGHAARMWKQRVWPRYKPLIWFYKPNNGNGPTMFRDISDFIESQQADKTIHPWEQSTIEVKHIIESLTVENHIVLDPFMGYATTGLGALELGRKFIGIELDEGRFSEASQRLANF